MEVLHKCPVCSSKRTKIFLKGRDFLRKTKESYSIWSCLNCEHKFTNPRVFEQEIFQYYTENYYTKTQEKKERKANILQSVRDYIRFFIFKINFFPRKAFGNKKLLDVGCGSGSFVKYFSLLGWNTTGVEPDAKALAIAKNSCPDSIFIEGFLKNCETGDEYSAIVFSHVLEHTYDPIAELKLAKSLLCDDGQIFVTVPNANCFEAKIFGRFWRGYELPTHIHHFSFNSIIQVAELCGLGVTEVRQQFLPMSFVESVSFAFDLSASKFPDKIILSALYTLIYLPMLILSGLGVAPALRVTLEDKKSD